MCYVYEERFNDGVQVSDYKSFLVSRLARIYPLHLVTLGAELLILVLILSIGKFDLLPAHSQHLYRIDAIPVQLTFLQTVGIYNFDTFNAPAWSLSAEWWAYVVFPFLFLLFKRIGYKNWVLIFLIAILGWIGIEFFLSGLEPFMDHPLDKHKRTLDVNWHYGTIRGIVGFIAGMAVWQVFREERLKKVMGSGWTLFLLATIAALSMAMKFYDSFTVTVFAFIILSSAYGSRNIDKFYSLPFFRKLGDWSFSIYMWHMVLIHFVMLYFLWDRVEPIKGLLRPFSQGYPVLLVLVIFLIVTCIVGYFSFWYIETPTRKWIRKRFSK